jgi:hypothetical protein
MSSDFGRQNKARFPTDEVCVYYFGNVIEAVATSRDLTLFSSRENERRNRLETSEGLSRRGIMNQGGGEMEGEISSRPEDYRG